MPLTPYPGMPNVPWGNQMGAFPSPFVRARNEISSHATPFNMAATAALIYVGYRLFKGAKETHRRAKRSIRKYSYVSAAQRAAAKAAASQFDQEFK